MWSRLKSRFNAKADSRLKLLFWATFTALLVGATGFAAPIDTVSMIIRNKIVSKPASGDIVIVGIDDKSVDSLASWPWPREYHAQLIDELNRLGAKKILLDITFTLAKTPAGDRALAAAIERAKPKVVLAAKYSDDIHDDQKSGILPQEAFRKNAKLVNINWWENGFGHVWRLRYADSVNGVAMPSMSAELAEISPKTSSSYPIDYSTSLDSIPYVSAVDVISGQTPLASVANKSVIIAPISRTIGDIHFVPGNGPRGGGFIHVLGAETLKRGIPTEIGWFPPILLIAPFIALFLLHSNRLIGRTALVTICAALIFLPSALNHFMIFAQYGPAITLVGIVLVRSSWMTLRVKSETTNKLSGLSNLNALKSARVTSDEIIVVARIASYAKAVAAVPASDEKEFVDQIIRRLDLGRAEHGLYHADHGIFAWVLPPSFAATLGDHLEGVRSLFMLPVIVDGSPIDISITFGTDSNNDSPPARRFSRALAAASDAERAGVTWLSVDASRDTQRKWDVSLVGRLNEAIDAGHVWVAYQPKVDIKTGMVCGAEALARWSDPERGEIPPDEFVLAAEAQNRIVKLTNFVLSEAAAVAARIVPINPHFSVAVNLSPRALDTNSVVTTVRTVLRQHKLAARHLTVELTETAGIEESPTASASLDALRKLGVRISIDDYGTGYSTLDYMTKIPAHEIKIDKTFIQKLVHSQPNRKVVASTIDLAHNMNRTVVAEGVEDEATLDVLAKMGCDLAQGYLMGKPMREDALMARIEASRPDLRRRAG